MYTVKVLNKSIEVYDAVRQVRKYTIPIADTIVGFPQVLGDTLSVNVNVHGSSKIRIYDLASGNVKCTL